MFGDGKELSLTTKASLLRWDGRGVHILRIEGPGRLSMKYGTLVIHSETGSVGDCPAPQKRTQRLKNEMMLVFAAV